jgi:hypothetical protein
LERKKIALDFDGTLAHWPRGITPSYVDPIICYAQAKACPIMTSICRDFIDLGFELHIVTGRSKSHQDLIERWTQEFLGPANTHCRPDGVGLGCASQTGWKASILQALEPVLYIGDNELIDKAAARHAEVPYVDVRLLIQNVVRFHLDPLGALWKQYVAGLLKV